MAKHKDEESSFSNRDSRPKESGRRTPTDKSKPSYAIDEYGTVVSSSEIWDESVHFPLHNSDGDAVRKSDNRAHPLDVESIPEAEPGGNLDVSEMPLTKDNRGKPVFARRPKGKPRLTPAQERIAKRKQELEERYYVAYCRYCGQRVHKKDLQQHNEERHSFEIQCKYCNKRVKLTELKAHNARYHPRRGNDSANAKPQRRSSKDRKISNTYLVDEIARYSKSNRDRYNPELPQYVNCPVCNGKMRAKKLEKHLKKVHSLPQSEINKILVDLSR